MTIKVNVVVVPSAICFNSMGSTKQVHTKLLGIIITISTSPYGKGVLKCVRLHTRDRCRVEKD